MKILTSLLLFIARVSIAAIFITAGISKLMNYDDTAKYMVANGFTMVPLFLFGAAAIELIGGVFLIIGFKIRWAAFVLLAFLIPTTLIFHAFWTQEGAARAINEIMFFKNLAIFGGLIYVICFGGGKFSCNGCKPQTSPDQQNRPPA